MLPQQWSESTKSRWVGYFLPNTRNRVRLVHDVCLVHCLNSDSPEIENAEWIETIEAAAALME